jgi:hypothetical protein
VACDTSTRGDKCYDRCCAKQTGNGNEFSACVVGARCKDSAPLTTTYASCINDDDGNICKDKCCGTYNSFNVTACENGLMCQGVYTPAILAKATVTDLQGASKESSGGISTPTAIAVGVITAVGVIGIIVAIILFVRYRKLKSKLKKIKREGVYEERSDDERKRNE